MGALRLLVGPPTVLGTPSCPVPRCTWSSARRRPTGVGPPGTGRAQRPAPRGPLRPRGGRCRSRARHAGRGPSCPPPLASSRLAKRIAALGVLDDRDAVDHRQARDRLRGVQGQPHRDVAAPVVPDDGEPLVPEQPHQRADVAGQCPLRVGPVVVVGRRPGGPPVAAQAGAGEGPSCPPPLAPLAAGPCRRASPVATSSGTTRCQVVCVRGCPCSRPPAARTRPPARAAGSRRRRRRTDRTRGQSTYHCTQCARWESVSGLTASAA
jgi:hypothetical protein